MRVMAAMSGGVDSAVMAARLVAQGHEVIGVHLDLYRTDRADIASMRGCASLTHTEDAQAIADKLGIPFEVWDFTDRFVDIVVDDFFSEYQAGRTPNPCLKCNEKIKFESVLERGIAEGFDAIATGHYARIEHNSAGSILRRGVDAGKDQSYVLAVLGQPILSRCLFPLGDSLKPDVRAEAAALGFHEVASKPDSEDICFIPDGDTAGFLRRELGTKQGEIVDTAGTVVGRHDGYHQFTVGQRRGLHLGSPSQDGQPRYVLKIDPVRNEVLVGGAEELLVSYLSGIRPKHTLNEFPVDFTPGLAQVRAHGKPVPCRYRICDEELQVELAEPIRGVALGQSVVVYDEDRVIGSAVIATTRLG